MSEEEQVLLTPEQAIAMLPDGDTVHTFRNPSGMMIGADWSRAAVVEEINKSEYRELGGEVARALGHSLILRPKGAQYQRDLLFVETCKEK